MTDDVAKKEKQILKEKAEELLRELQRHEYYKILFTLHDHVSEPDETWNDGYYTSVGYWLDRKDLELGMTLDGFLAYRGEKTFWVGLCAERKRGTDLLRRIQLGYGSINFRFCDADVTRDRISEDEVYRLKKRQPRNILGSLVFEESKEAQSTWLGIYQSQANYSVEHALKFFDSLFDQVDQRDLEIFEIENSERSDTEKEQLIQARRGQGKFRAELDSYWGGKCAVTEVGMRELLRASHIKPWKLSNDKERLNGDNGLLLVAGLDALFDKYLISFDETGAILISKRLREKEGERMAEIGLSKDLRLRSGEPHCDGFNKDRHGQFLEHHRDIFNKMDS